MRKIAVCVCTYNRPRGLGELLDALEFQRFRRLRNEHVCLIVVDNSHEGAAEANWRAFGKGCRYGLRFLHEPRKGLAYARNAAVAAAGEAGASHIVFIDDDELPCPSWLEALFETVEQKQAAAAIGPVYPIFERPPSPWLPIMAYVACRPAVNGFVDDGYTGNAIICRAALAPDIPTFDLSFNETGGEDTMFFKHLRARGLRIAWSENAVAHTITPKQRMSPQWLFSRWYRTGDIEARLGKYDSAHISGRLYNVGRGMGRIIAGSGYLIAIAILKSWTRPDAVTASLFTICRGAGLIASAFGRRYKEYADPSYR